MKNNITILIIDDEFRIRRFLKIELKDFGFNVLEAESGKEAISIINNNEDIDLILLDINFPKENGTEIFQKIKKINSNIKIIISSVYSIDEQQFLIPDADDYYDKSNSIDLLINKIEYLLKKDNKNV